MFEAFFTDPCMRYRTEVINGIDFYGLGFSMVRGECVAEGTLRWMQKGEAAAVLITKRCNGRQYTPPRKSATGSAL